jgi:capsular polysaccharide biosynthesis protein
VEIFTDKNNLEVVSNDNRLDNEEVLEQYFESLGYEIVCPDDFNSFQEQLNYMYSVKKLVSVSGSGLTNSLFMQPSQTVVELVTPLCIPLDDEDNPYKSILIEDLHHFYSTMAFKKHHKYVALNNQEKSASSIINQIEKDPSLKQFLGSI